MPLLPPTEPQGEALWAPACSAKLCLLSVLYTKYGLQGIHQDLHCATTFWEKAAEKISKQVFMAFVS